MAWMPVTRAIVLAAVLGLALSQSCFYPVEEVLDPPPDQHGMSGAGGSLSLDSGGESQGCHAGERCVRAKNVVVLTARAEFCTTLTLKRCDTGTCGCQTSGGNKKEAECTEQLSRPEGECTDWVGANNKTCTPTQARDFAAARSYVGPKHNVQCEIESGLPTLKQEEFCRFEPRACEGDPDSVCVTQAESLLLPSGSGVKCPAGYTTSLVFEPHDGVADPSCHCACEKCSAATYRLYSEQNCTDDWPMLLEADRHCRVLPRKAISYRLVRNPRCQPFAEMREPNRTLCTPVGPG